MFNIMVVRFTLYLRALEESKSYFPNYLHRMDKVSGVLVYDATKVAKTFGWFAYTFYVSISVFLSMFHFLFISLIEMQLNFRDDT